MPAGSVRSLRTLAVVIGRFTLVGIALLLLWDLVPARFPSHAHDALSASPLALIALAWLLHRLGSRPTRAELARAALLAAAFLFWSANQLWPDLPQATLFNDLAVALFVIDVWLAMAERPAPAPAEALRPDGADL